MKIINLETADRKALFQSLLENKPLDPEVKRRIRKRAKEITERIYRENGLVDIAVPTLREIRE